MRDAVEDQRNRHFGRQHALLRLDAFRQSVSKLVLHHRGQALPGMTVSIGLALFPDHGRHAAELVTAAGKLADRVYFTFTPDPRKNPQAAPTVERFRALSPDEGRRYANADPTRRSWQTERNLARALAEREAGA